MAIIGLMTISIKAQISSTPVKRPSVNTGITTKPISLPTPYEEIIRDLDQGKCFEIVVTSLQLNRRNTPNTLYNVETRHGIGALKKEGKVLKTTLSLVVGINQNRTPRALSTKVKLTSKRSGISLDIRNGQYYHLLYNLKIVKKKNGYFISAERDENSQTVSFTFAIIRAECLI